jgi:hypothetical protein
MDGIWIKAHTAGDQDQPASADLADGARDRQLSKPWAWRDAAASGKEFIVNFPQAPGTKRCLWFD